MGEGKSADFGLPLLGGLGDGDGDDCLINGLFRTVPILHLCRPPWSWCGVIVVKNGPVRVGIGPGRGMGMGIDKDSKKTCKHQHQ